MRDPRQARLENLSACSARNANPMTNETLLHLATQLQAPNAHIQIYAKSALPSRRGEYSPTAAPAAADAIRVYTH
jgi:hypothetical protein